MCDVILCDTNIVIQLSIICPELFLSPNFHLYIHPRVFKELRGLLRNPSKALRLGEKINWVLSNVEENPIYDIDVHSPEFRALDGQLSLLEESYSSDNLSAASSDTDRFLLIVAMKFDLKFITIEKTLTTLAKDCLSIDKVYTLPLLLHDALNAQVISKKDLRKNLNTLPSYGEPLKKEWIDDVEQLVR